MTKRGGMDVTQIPKSFPSKLGAPRFVQHSSQEDPLLPDRTPAGEPWPEVQSTQKSLAWKHPVEPWGCVTGQPNPESKPVLHPASQDRIARGAPWTAKETRGPWHCFSASHESQVSGFPVVRSI